MQATIFLPRKRLAIRYTVKPRYSGPFGKKEFGRADRQIEGHLVNQGTIYIDLHLKLVFGDEN